MEKYIKSIKYNIKKSIAENLDYITRDKNQICLFDTSMDSDNLGDNIIMYYCQNVMNDIFPNNYHYIYVPTHSFPSKENCQKVAKSNYKFLCGTNIISTSPLYNNFKMPSDYYGYKHVISLGVGTGSYYSHIDNNVKKLYNRIFTKKYYLSTRDSYTKNYLNELGFSNVLLTGCPTIWNLTKEFCASIPTKKSEIVITTITDYCQDKDNDAFMLDCLLKEYKKVYLWPQGKNDISYLDSFYDISKLNILNRSLDCFNDFLKTTDCDYIGTRLHAGIHALNHKKRTLIISIDNRAREMAKDFSLPTIERNQTINDLSYYINKPYICNITIPMSNIEKWKKQFAK